METITIETLQRAQLICSLLIANGYIPKADFADLMIDENLKSEVHNRLGAVGMKLLENPYSQHWAVGLTDATSADEHIEWSNNFGLDRGAMALLLILWSKLILPQRIAAKSEPALSFISHMGMESLQADNEDANPVASVSRDQLIAEFSDQLGGLILMSKYLSQLSRARLIKYHGNTIIPGPLLSLVINENDLMDELYREVLISVFRREKNGNGSAGVMDHEAIEVT